MNGPMDMAIPMSASNYVGEETIFFRLGPEGNFTRISLDSSHKNVLKITHWKKWTYLSRLNELISMNVFIIEFLKHSYM